MSAGSIFDPVNLARCISCGFCLPACPTYQESGQEEASPRGRIALMRAQESGAISSTDATVIEQVSQCLGCRACEPVCPAGVEYGSLLEQWRSHQWVGLSRPWIARILMVLVALPPRVLSLQGVVRRHARRRRPEATHHLMLGCVERGLYPQVSRNAAALLPDIDIPVGQGCCGALHAHNGDLAGGIRLAQQLGQALPGTIITTAGGCAAHLATHLGRDRVREFSEFVVEQGMASMTPVVANGRRARVALQDSCHQRNGLAITTEPRAIIAAVADLVELPSAASCCGAAGTYSLLRRKESQRILRAKVTELVELDVDFLVVSNPGCQRQMITGLKRSGITVLHIAELMAMSTKAVTQAS